MIILTGGAGFIGSCFLSKLNSMGIKDVIVVDNLGTENKWKNLNGKDFYRYYHKTEFRDIIRNNPASLGEIDYVAHLGACSSTVECDADYIMDNNTAYSIDLLKFAVEKDIPFMYASSAATYGDGTEGYSDDKFDELRPLNPYGFSKHQFDKWVINNRLVDKVIGLKYFNVFGPNEYHKGNMASMVYKSFNQVSETGEISLFKSNDPQYTDGGQMRDFIYVKDAVDVMWKMLEKGKGISGIYNLGTGEPHSWNELAEAIFNAMGLPKNIKYIDMPEKLSKQYQNYTKAEMGKMQRNGIEHKFLSLQDSVSDYINNHLAQDYKIF